MGSWTFLLQLEGVTGHVRPSCKRYAVSGVALPTQISIIACDSNAESSAQKVHNEIENRLTKLSNNLENCNGPGGNNCMAWGEPSCRHILVLLVGSVPLDQSFELLASDWLKKGGVYSKVLPVFVGGITHDQVFVNNLFPILSACNLVSWGNSPHRLADLILSQALIDEKPGVFISYLRTEASKAADQIHDALIRCGFRVFLDRFSGTPGRLFPQELAEAMSGMGLVVLLETQGLKNSRWTMWEAAFAHRYRIGPIAINFNNSSQHHSTSVRHNVSNDPLKSMHSTTVDDIVKFIQVEHLNVAISRRSYYETLVRLAAKSKSGDVTRIGANVLKIADSQRSTKGFALLCGVPGQLKHIRRLVETKTGGCALLAGEHIHLPPSDLSDLEWLAAKEKVMLTGSASIYRVVSKIV
jgi:TIR domain